MIGAAGCAPLRSHGPMAVRDQHPTQLLVMAQPPRSAAALPAGTVQGTLAADYASLFLGQATSDHSFVMDGELLRAAVNVRVGVVPGLDLEAELPILHASSGFLDQFIADYHDLFDLPQSGRDHAPMGQYRVEASRGGVIGYELTEDGVRFGDLPILAHVELFSESPQRPGLALRGGVELPTGSGRHGTGNGHWDVSLGLVSEWHVWDLGLTLGAYHTFTEGTRESERAGFPLEDVSSLNLGVEWEVAATWSLLVQSTLSTSTLRGLDLNVTDRPQWLLWIGARMGVLPGVAFEAAFAEDLVPDISPDFSVRAALVVRAPGTTESP
jgi:hypothetical protein